MDSEASATTSAQAEEELRPGQLLAKQHAEEEARRQATVEDVVDEEDIAHPPPSATPRSEELSEKAAGKKPAQELNTQSEEAFPALGAPKARAAAVPSAWGGKSSNGVNGGANGRPASSNVSSRASTPASGMMTPASTAASHTVSLPGRHTESIDFAPSQLQPRNQLKKPVQDVLRDINRGSKARVQMKQGAGGRIIFEGQGPVEAVRQSLKEVAKELGAKVSASRVSGCDLLTPHSKASKSLYQPRCAVTSSVEEVPPSKASSSAPVPRCRCRGRTTLQHRQTMTRALRSMSLSRATLYPRKWLAERLRRLSMNAHPP